LQPAQSAVWKFAHLVHILVAAGIDSRVHLTRILTQHFARGGADLTTQSESQTSYTLHLVLHHPMHTVRQQPARKKQRVATAVRAILVDQRTTKRRAARTTTVYIHRAPAPLLHENSRVSPHQLSQLARAQFRPTAATPNRNEQLRMYKNCVIMAAHIASQ